MADYPPPPSSAARPGPVIAAGILLIVGGGLAILFLGIGALELYAGIQVLALKEIGRTIGIVLAAISGVLSLISIAKTPSTSIVQIAIDAFIIWALTQNAAAFHR